MNEDYSVIKVTWVDSTSVEPWLEIDVVLGFEPCTIETVGIMIADEDEFITLVQSIGYEESQVANSLMIPKPCIQDITILE